MARPDGQDPQPGSSAEDVGAIPAKGKDWDYSRKDRSRRNGPIRRRFRDFRRRVLSPLVPMLVPPLLKLMARTWRLRSIRGERKETVLQSPEGCIAVLWHGRMAAAASVFSGVEAVVLVSMSGDGEMAKVMLERLGYRTLRGSTGKVGVGPLRSMQASLKGGTTVAITPDGPRGPRHRVNRGAAFLARDTGLPILPIGFGFSRAARLKSWDRFTIPLPFSRVQVAFGDPIHVAADATDRELIRLSRRVGEVLMEAEVEAFGALGEEVDW